MTADPVPIPFINQLWNTWWFESLVMIALFMAMLAIGFIITNVKRDVGIAILINETFIIAFFVVLSLMQGWWTISNSPDIPETVLSVTLKTTCCS